MYVLVVFLIDYVKILQPVAICTIIFVTAAGVIVDGGLVAVARLVACRHDC